MNKKNNLLLKKDDYIGIFVCIVIVSLLFLPTINRPWLAYDERMIYDSVLFSVQNSFSDIFELVGKVGTGINVFSSNSLYTSNYLIRFCPLGLIRNLFVSFFLKKSPLLYHLLNLSFHLINTILVYLILRRVTLVKKINNFLVILCTLIWACHPTIVEAVMLSTNFGATISYTFSFLLIFEFLINREKSESLLRVIFIPFLYLIPMLTNEYIFTLPFIIFIISFYLNFQTNSLRKAIKISTSESKPYFLGMFLYLISVVLFASIKVVKPPIYNPLALLLEQTFWLSPQIIIHFIKLIFFPTALSIDQSLLLKLGRSLFDPYAVFSLIAFLSSLILPLLLLRKSKRFSPLFLITWSFFFAILPFSHLISPSYLLAAERYLYFPIAVILISIFLSIENIKTQKLTTILTCLLFVICISKSYIRTLDWKDNFSFVNSTYKITNDNFIKAVKLYTLSEPISTTQIDQNTRSKEYFVKVLDLLQLAKQETLLEKKRFQKRLPLILKSYGLDYDSKLSKIAFLEASIRCLNLWENPDIGITILNPFIKRLHNLDPRAIEVYTDWLVAKDQLAEAKSILLKANKAYPHISSILIPLFNISVKQNDSKSANEYIEEALKFYPLDLRVLGKAIVLFKYQRNHLRAGRLAYTYGLLSGSTTAYKQALSSFVEIGDYRTANKIANKLLKLFPNDPESLFYISKYYYGKNDFNNALLILQNAYQLSLSSPSNPKLIFDIGYNLAKLQVTLNSEGIAKLTLKDLEKLAGNDPTSLVKIARLYKKLGLKEELDNCKKKILALSKRK